tara:strand:- start:3037 stop:4395 length:1359 start_codon:yes stop_codon:yes gene_type:complete
MSDIRARRNALLKSSISIKAIGNSVTNFTKGLFKARSTASDIAQQTNENNKFKRTLIGNDERYFTKRRENARRIQREDELEASTTQGVAKRQGALVSRSTKGFLGRILDFFGIVLIGWFVNNLPGIIKAIQGLINRIRKITTILTNFIDYIGDFLTNIRVGITDAISKLPFIDLLGLKRANEEKLDEANINLNKSRNDLIDIASEYDQGGGAVGLQTESGEEDIPELVVPPETPEPSGDTESDKTEEQGDGQVEGQKNETNENNITPSDNKKEDDDSDLVDGMPNDMNLDEMNDNQTQTGDANSQESIESRDNQRGNEEASSESLVEGVKTFISNFFGGKDRNEQTVEEPKVEDTALAQSIIEDIKGIEKEANTIIESGDINGMKGEKVVNLSGGRRDRNKVIVIEKPVYIQSGGGGGVVGGSNNSNMQLSNSNNEYIKNAMKQMQSIILSL